MHNYSSIIHRTIYVESKEFMLCDNNLHAFCFHSGVKRINFAKFYEQTRVL